MINLKKKYQQDVQIGRVDGDMYKQLDKKEKTIAELKARLDLKDQ